LNFCKNGIKLSVNLSVDDDQNDSRLIALIIKSEFLKEIKKHSDFGMG